MDENGVPVASVQVVANSPSGQTVEVYTDSSGQFALEGLAEGRYKFSLSKTGFFRVPDRPVELKEGLNEARFTLHHETEIRESVEVLSTPNPIEPGESAHQQIMVAREIRDTPVPNSHDLQSVLPAMPEIVRDNSGQLHVAGGRAGETQLFLDGFEIGDPVTGALTARVNVDAVREIEVNAGRYGVQHGRGGAGVLALHSAVGDDKWRAGTTNFIPGITVQDGVHLGNWFPRFTVSGPVKKGRAWFSDALSLQHTFHLVSELPRNENTSTQWAGDNLLRAQVNLTPRNLLQGSFLYARQDLSHLGLGPFSPLSTTRNVHSERSLLAVKDQAWVRRAFFEVGLAADFGHMDTLPMGSEPYVVQPSATAGNYFQALHHEARRLQGIAVVTLPARKWHGVHNLQAGVNIQSTSWTQQAERTQIDVQRQDGTLLQRTTFSGPASFNISDTQIGLYAQDSWTVLKPLVLQAGLRGDWDRFLQHSILSPRVAANIVPWSDNRARLALAWGIYYQPLLLGTVGPAFDQQRLDTFFDPHGAEALIGPIVSRFVLPAGGLNLSNFRTASIEWTQRIPSNSYGGIALISRKGRNGFAYEPQPSISGTRMFLLQDKRSDRYRAVQLSFRRMFANKAELSVHYTRSSASSNEVLDYSLGTLIFSPQQPGPLEWDAPNRLISSGWAPAPFWGLFLSYFFEYKTGFPFSVVNEQQQLVGPPNRLRFPDYVGLNLGIEKHFRILSRVWAIRLAIINASGHFNPDSVINNIDSPDYLKFAGGQHRAVTARVRLVG